MPQFDLNNYVDVQTRIRTFWENHPAGAIRTVLASPEADFEKCRYRAEVYKDSASAYPDAVGYAFEVAGGRGPNSTSHEENCETSAIGRALANMGYATSGKDRPSRQEMAKVPSGEAPVRPQASTASRENRPQQAVVNQRPTDIGSARPAPQQANTGEVDERWKALSAKAHARASHDALHSWALDKGLDSFAKASIPQIAELMNWISKDAGLAEFNAKHEPAGNGSYLSPEDEAAIDAQYQADKRKREAGR